MSGAIEAFVGDFRFLSNFFPARVVLDGVAYRSVEHAYQAAKTLDPVRRAEIARCPTAADAKRAGRRLPLRQDWLAVRVDVMASLVRSKFSDPALAARLLGTGERELVEGNWWGDVWWGRCRGEGQNWLGRILMQVRDELRKAGAT